ncbi:MAG: magnesium transporter [Candidatus Latescibacteria bacterium]|jgi:magnesium transporter|nr:magnesium transporter [Candidatus Latescibacterota bacterium]
MPRENGLPDLAGGEPAGRVEALIELTHDLLGLEDPEALKRVLDEQRPADLADLLRRLDDETREAVFKLLDTEPAAEALAEADTPTIIAIADDLGHQELSDLVEEMEPDDAADVLGDLEEEDAEKILDLMEDEEAQEVQELMTHEEDTGGGIMTPRLVLAHASSRVSDVVDTLRQEAEDAEIYCLFVVDEEDRLQGVVPLHLLVTARPDTVITSLMDRDVISVTTDMDQEEIAQLFVRYDLTVAPVVDEDQRVVGQITVDDAMDVLVEEATEDLYRMAGTSGDEAERDSVFGVAFTRLPWLLLCLLGSFLSGLVISFFDVTLEKAITLAAFIPVIMATGGNSGLQASTVTVRGLVMGNVASGLLVRTVLRETGTAVVIGLICGLAASGVAWIWFGEALVGVCVGVAMFLVICLAVLLGVLAPLFFNRVGIDPAVASGPFITTTNDILGLLIYLGLATLLIQKLSGG